ncbi:MAG: CBS domain-containing protein [Nitrososphaeraceae archaeon]
MSKKNVVSIQTNSNVTALDITKLMVKNKVGSVLVIDSTNFPIGIITERDIIKKVCVTNTLPNEMNLDKIMSSPVITIMSYDSIESAAQKMTDYKIKRLPVLEENHQIVSILSLTDIIKHLSKIMVNDYNRFGFLKSIVESG